MSKQIDDDGGAGGASETDMTSCCQTRSLVVDCSSLSEMDDVLNAHADGERKRRRNAFRLHSNFRLIEAVVEMSCLLIDIDVNYWQELMVFVDWTIRESQIGRHKHSTTRTIGFVNSLFCHLCLNAEDVYSFGTESNSSYSSCSDVSALKCLFLSLK